METPLSPEQLVIQMSVGDIQELLGALGLDRSNLTADRFRMLVKLTKCLETSIEILLEESRLPRAA